ARERFLHARRLLRLEPGVRRADDQRSRAAGQVAVAREHNAVSEMAAERGLERRRRCRELLDRGSLARLEVEDPQSAVEPRARRTDLRDRRLGDLEREVPPRLIVEVGIERRSAEPLAEPGRATQRLARALRPHPIGDPFRGSQLSIEAARHHHRVDTRLESGDDDILDRDIRDAAHVERIRHGEAIEPQLAPQEIGQDRAGDRRGSLAVERGVADVSAHRRRRSRRERAPERKELAALEPRAARSALRGSPVAPMAMALGKTARYPTRTTVPPSWSTAIGTGGRSPRTAASCASRTIARTWSFERMFPRKAKRTRPPIFPARIASRIGPGTCSPSKPAQTSAPVPSSVTTSAAGDTARA